MEPLLSLDPPRVSFFRRAHGLLALLFAPAACGETAPIEVVRSDSAGVEIVTSRVRGPSLPPALQVEGSPALDLAMTGGDGQWLASVSAGVLLPDDEFALIMRDGTLARFGPSGNERWRRSVGALSLARGPGDSVTVMVADGDSVAVVAPSGDVRVSALSWSGPEPLSVLLPWQGGFVAITGWSTRMLPQGVAPGIREDPAHVVRFTRGGSVRDTLVTLPGNEIGLVNLGGRLTIAPPHFGRLTVLAVSDDRVWVGAGVDDEIVEIDPSGSEVRRVRRAGRDVAISPEAAAAAVSYRQRIVGRNPVSEALTAALDQALPMPEAHPPYGQLAADGEGRLWVADYPLPGEPPLDWALHGADGALLGSVTLPVRFRLLDVAEGRVLGQVLGPGGATVRVYALTSARGAPAGG
jgi:hypothetical protein